jgi:hypothetical protein
VRGEERGRIRGRGRERGWGGGGRRQGVRDGGGLEGKPGEWLGAGAGGRGGRDDRGGRRGVGGRVASWVRSDGAGRRTVVCHFARPRWVALLNLLWRFRAPGDRHARGPAPCRDGPSRRAGWEAHRRGGAAPRWACRGKALGSVGPTSRPDGPPRVGRGEGGTAGRGGQAAGGRGRRGARGGVRAGRGGAPAPPGRGGPLPCSGRGVPRDRVRPWRQPVRRSFDGTLGLARPWPDPRGPTPPRPPTPSGMRRRASKASLPAGRTD